MTLDEAIKHEEERMVDNLDKTKDRNSADPVAIESFEIADKHRQIADMLKELKMYRTIMPSLHEAVETGEINLSEVDGEK